MFKTFGAVQHRWSPLGFIVVFVDLPSFAIVRDERARLSNACTLRRSGRTAQSNLGNDPSSNGVTEPYKGLGRTNAIEGCELPECAAAERGAR